MSDYVRKVSDYARKVLDGVRKVSDCIGKVSHCVGKVSEGFREEPRVYLKDSWYAQSIFYKTPPSPRVFFKRLLAGSLCETYGN